MTQEQINIEKVRINKLNAILWWIEGARIKIGIQEFNLSSSNIAGEGVQYSDRIEILNKVIDRLDVRYFKVLNG